jgi:hypothetical protein
MAYQLDEHMTTTSVLLDVARGHYNNLKPINLFGFNRGVGTEFETIWNDSAGYVYPAAASVLSVVSSSASDTMNVLISGLDADYVEITETVTLTGTSAVSTTQAFFRVNSAVILSGSNVGNISASIGGTIHGWIEAGQGVTQACVYTVPAGKSLYLLRIDLTSGTVTGNKYLTYRQTLRASNGRVLKVAEATWQGGQQSFDRQVPFVISEKTDFQFECKSSSSTNEVSIFVEGLLGWGE